MELCQIDAERCKGCELCVLVCPKDALAMGDWRNPSGFHPAWLAVPERCNGCALCAQVCPETAITVYRRLRKRARDAALSQG